ncbi:arylsulfatase [Pedosphaera parvula]|uniref:Sulfatase n=1 Tax=Pedosphaera parvula (strain Ellin514) TaxID=320771 RepID=B9XR48_PEDPL|nr:arylsulfatase [Pedosphaera parvula]EEF57661.1 sulfatase [Pedosphaera parvula Ellin514]
MPKHLLPRRLRFLVALLSVLSPLCINAAEPSPMPLRKPNVIFFIADDLGYADVGCFGQKKIHTPNIDRIATEGMKFTQHYSGSPVCAPSRCVLMTGKHSGHSAVRDNRELKPEGQFPLPANTITVARLLQQNGYITGAFGKWGLGGPESSGKPLDQGFTRFFGYNCQRVAHNLFPTYLWDDNHRLALDNPPIGEDQKLPADADSNDPASYKAFTGKSYAPDLYAEQALRFIRDNKDHPFFLFFPTIVPHVALQVPEDSLKEYEGKLPETPYTGGKGYLPNRTPHAAYAAMITRMDRDLGRMLALIKELNLDDDTIFVFTSDNGPAPQDMGGTDTKFFNSSGPFRSGKTSIYEGGMRIPLIVRWHGKIQPNSTSDRVTGFEDWLPTLLELSGNKKSVPTGIDGLSFASTLLGEKLPERPFLYREFPAYGGQQAIRVGNWKAVRQHLKPKGNAKPNLHIELYDLQTDIAESHDVSDEHPDIVTKLDNLMREQHIPSKAFPFPALDKPGSN